MKKIEDMLHTLPNPKLRALRSSLDKISYALMIKETTHGHDPDELIHKIENAISKTTGDIGRTGEMEEPKGANTDYSDYSDYYDYTPGTSSGRFGYLNGPRNAGGRIPSPQDRMMMGGPPSMDYQFNPSLGNLRGEERNFKAWFQYLIVCSDRSLGRPIVFSPQDSCNARNWHKWINKKPKAFAFSSIVCSATTTKSGCIISTSKLLREGVTKIGLHLGSSPFWHQASFVLTTG